MPHQHRRASGRQSPDVQHVRTLSPAHWRATRWLTALLVCATSSGCEFGRSHFQMNSNSPMPFFGIDLVPRRKTTSLGHPPREARVGSTEAARVNVQTVAHSPSRIWLGRSHSPALNSHQSVVVLPLKQHSSDPPINRGPVELFP